MFYDGSAGDEDGMTALALVRQLHRKKWLGYVRPLTHMI